MKSVFLARLIGLKINSNHASIVRSVVLSQLGCGVLGEKRMGVYVSERERERERSGFASK